MHRGLLPIDTQVQEMKWVLRISTPTLQEVHLTTTNRDNFSSVAMRHILLAGIIQMGIDCICIRVLITFATKKASGCRDVAFFICRALPTSLRHRVHHIVKEISLILLNKYLTEVLLCFREWEIKLLINYGSRRFPFCCRSRLLPFLPQWDGLNYATVEWVCCHSCESKSEYSISYHNMIQWNMILPLVWFIVRYLMNTVCRIPYAPINCDLCPRLKPLFHPYIYRAKTVVPSATIEIRNLRKTWVIVGHSLDPNNHVLCVNEVTITYHINTCVCT